VADKLRIEKLEEQIKRDLSTLILKRARDARLKTVAIMGVRVTRDLELAKVYVSILGQDSEIKEVLEALEKASGFFRSELGALLGLRRVPELRFILDNTLEESMRIEGLFKELGYPDNVDE